MVNKRSGHRMGCQQVLHLGGVEAVGEVIHHPQTRLPALLQCHCKRTEDLIGTAVSDRQAEPGGDGADLPVVLGVQLLHTGWPVVFMAAVGAQPVDAAWVGSTEPQGVLLDQ